MQFELSYLVPVFLMIILMIGFVIWLRANNEITKNNDEIEYDLGLQHALNGFTANNSSSEAYMDGFSDGEKKLASKE